MRPLIQIKIFPPAKDLFSPVMEIFKVKEILGHTGLLILSYQKEIRVKRFRLASVGNLLFSNPYLAIHFTMLHVYRTHC